MTEITPAWTELADLVCKMRNDWDRRDVDGAIYAAGIAAQEPSSGWTWARTATDLVRLACDLSESPRALSDACHDPRNRQAPVDPAPFAEEARQMMTEALAASDAESGVS
jgi:hypothetical protein